MERRHAQLAKVYPTLYGSAAEGEAAVGGQDGGAQDVAAEGKGNIFKKEFGHLSHAAQERFREDRLVL